MLAPAYLWATKSMADLLIYMCARYLVHQAEARRDRSLSIHLFHFSTFASLHLGHGLRGWQQRRRYHVAGAMAGSCPAHRFSIHNPYCFLILLKV
jgi:hypothetical protein